MRACFVGVSVLPSFIAGLPQRNHTEDYINDKLIGSLTQASYLLLLTLTKYSYLC